MTRILCLAIDVINPDKPAASLAFLSGVCEYLCIDYLPISLNTELLLNYTAEQYDQVYVGMKLGEGELLDTVLQPVLPCISKQLKDYRPDLVMVSLFSSMQFPLAITVLSHLRQQGYNGDIIAGGPGVQTKDTQGETNGRKLLNLGYIDYYVLGEGDEVLVRWLQGERILPGVNSRRSLIFGETWVPQINDLDRYYIKPSYRKINLDVYHNLEAKSKAVLSISTSRGCVRSCTFCDVKNLWPKYRYRSGRSVAEEVLSLHQETGAVNFTMVDSLINGSLKSFREFNATMVDLRRQHASLAEFTYNGQFIVRDALSHSEDFFDEMRKAGCESLIIGVETGSDRLRHEMAKKFTNKDLDWHLEMSRRYGIRNTLLMFVGYPTETRTDFQQSLDLLDRYQHYLIDNTIIAVTFTGIFSLATDTPVYDQAEHLGIEIVPTDTLAMKQLNWINHNNLSLTVRERINRDLEFRRRAAELRYPIPYSDRYLEYLKHIDQDFVPVCD